MSYNYGLVTFIFRNYKILLVLNIDWECKMFLMLDYNLWIEYKWLSFKFK